jgi:hypothetical protein
MNPEKDAREIRFPLVEFIEALTALFDAVANDPKLVLRDWLELYFQERQPDVTNEAERAQLLLNALRYYEVNRRELDQDGGIVLGEDHSLYPPELLAALYSVVLTFPWQTPEINFPVSEFMKLVKRQKDAWGEK